MIVGDWTRALLVTGAAGMSAGAALLIAPWMLVPFVLAGLFAAGFAVDGPNDDRATRKRVAHRTGLVAWVVVALAWSAFTEHVGATRVLLAATLGAGAGVAVLGTVLIGMDARTLMRPSSKPEP